MVASALSFASAHGNDVREVSILEGMIKSVNHEYIL